MYGCLGCTEISRILIHIINAMPADDQFRKEMESLGVTPLGESQKATPEKERPVPNNKNSIEADRQVLVESMSTNPALSKHAAESGEELKKSGLATRDFTRLKQGKYYREDELYLRGYTVENAVKKLKLFIHESTRSGHRCIKIIHGKGVNSPDGISHIKLQCQHHLALNRYVLGYCRALPNDGGTGAKYVLLKKWKF